MILRIILILNLTLALTSCGGAAATQAPAQESPATEAAATEAPATEAPVATEPPAFQSLEAPTGQPSAAATSTAIPTQIVATRTDTPLPTLELPTEVVNAPARMVWDGTPTYLGESTPGYAFRVTYDPEVWALTTDQFGFPALGHRNIPACVMSVSVGRGLPPSMTVDHQLLDLGDVTFDVGEVFENGVLKFVTFTGGDGTIFTGFEVSFIEDEDECLADARTVLSTLTAVPTSQATPTP
ncbi:MAG TPA: hypothetical protein VK897_07855 [Anaerolineales bacterium]|nr:hypothetical protein [Anaerolineales bacterium]